MRRFFVSILAVALVSLTVVVAGPAKTKPPVKKKVVVAFVGTYAGQASVQRNGSIATISANGTGKGTLIGAGSIVGLGTGDTSQQPCVPFAGTGKMTGPGGTIIFKVVPGSNGCGDETGTNFAITAHFIVLKATGKLLKATGTLKATGAYNNDDGSFSVKVAGKLTK